MADTDIFLGEISFFGFDFPPRGWALCNGQLLSINQNQVLFALLGVQFGGDGRTTFALPNLQSRTPIGQIADKANPFPVGTMVGEETHVLTADETPYHSHNVMVLYNPDATKNTPTPSGDVVLTKATANTAGGAPIDNFMPYVTGTKEKPLPNPDQKMHPAAIGNPPGSGQPHANVMPFLTLSACIALDGIIPTRG